MEESKGRSAPIRFGIFEVDLRAGELRRQGLKIKLQEQPFQVLAMLLERPGELVTREEIQKQLWPAHTFVDFEPGLNRAMNKLREALADDAESPRFIETLPRRGYRFIAPAETTEPSTRHPLTLMPTDRPAEAPVAAPKRPLLKWAAAGVFALAALGTVAIRSNGPKNSPRLLRLQVAPPAGGTFVEGISATTGGMALSPDGETLAFIAFVDGVTGLWVQPLDGIARKLPSDGLPLNPFWSPDGKSIGYFQSNSLRRIDTAGGAPVIICSLPFAGGYSGAWSEDGRILIGSVFEGLKIVPASGGTPTPLTTLDTSAGERSHLFPQILPGGRFLYWTFTNKPETEAIFAASLVKPQQRQRLITAESSAVYASGHLLWRSGKALMTQALDADELRLTGQTHKLLEPITQGILNEVSLTASATGRLIYDAGGPGAQYKWFERSGRLIGAVGEPSAWAAARLSPDGKRIVIGGGAAIVHWGLGLFDEHRQTGALMANLVTLNPTWSPDGKTIAFGQPGIGLGRTTTTGEGARLPLTTSDNEQVPTDWSGDTILFTEASPKTGRDIWSLRVNSDGSPVTGTKPEPYVQTPFVEVAARFAPGRNEHWVAYQSNESGRPEVYIQSFPVKGEKLAVSRGGGVYPVWGPEARELFYLTLDHQLMAVDVKLSAHSVQTGTPHELFPTPNMENEALYSSPYGTSDGQRFLVRVPLGPPTRPFNAIDNWPLLLTQ